MYKNFDEWREKNLDNHIADFGAVFNDSATTEYLSKYFTGYMSQPIETINGVELTAKSKAAFTIEEMDIHFNKLSKTHDIYLYKLLYMPSFPTMVDVNKENYMPIFLTKPRMTNCMWKIRYEAMEKKNDK